MCNLLVGYLGSYICSYPTVIVFEQTHAVVNIQLVNDSYIRIITPSSSLILYLINGHVTRWLQSRNLNMAYISYLYYVCKHNSSMHL